MHPCLGTPALPLHKYKPNFSSELSTDQGWIELQYFWKWADKTRYYW